MMITSGSWGYLGGTAVMNPGAPSRRVRFADVVREILEACSRSTHNFFQEFEHFLSFDFSFTLSFFFFLFSFWIRNLKMNDAGYYYLLLLLVLDLIRSFTLLLFFLFCLHNTHIPLCYCGFLLIVIPNTTIYHHLTKAYYY